MLGSDAVVIAASAAIFLLANALNLGIIWHEATASEAKRTLINRFIKNHCVLSVAMVNIGLAVGVSSIVFSSVFEPACDLAVVLLKILLETFLMNADVIVIIRYLYICRFKNVGVFDDDFVYVFASVATVLISAHHAVLFWTFDFHRDERWHRCAGVEFAAQGQTAKAAQKSVQLLGISTLILHVTLYGAIFRHERSMEAATASASAASVKFSSEEQGPIIKNYNDVSQRSFVNLGTSVAGVAIAVLGSIFAIHGLRLAQEEYGLPQAELEQLRTLWVCFVGFVVVPALYYLKNREMRQRVLGRWIPPCAAR